MPRRARALESSESAPRPPTMLATASTSGRVVGVGARSRSRSSSPGSWPARTKSTTSSEGRSSSRRLPSGPPPCSTAMAGRVAWPTDSVRPMPCTPHTVAAGERPGRPREPHATTAAAKAHRRPGRPQRGEHRHGCPPGRRRAGPASHSCTPRPAQRWAGADWPTPGLGRAEDEVLGDERAARARPTASSAPTARPTDSARLRPRVGEADDARARRAAPRARRPTWCRRARRARGSARPTGCGRAEVATSPGPDRSRRESSTKRATHGPSRATGTTSSTSARARRRPGAEDEQQQRGRRLTGRAAAARRRRARRWREPSRRWP